MGGGSMCLVCPLIKGDHVVRPSHGVDLAGRPLLYTGRFVSVRPPVGGSPFCCSGSLQYRSDRLRCAPTWGPPCQVRPNMGEPVRLRPQYRGYRRVVPTRNARFRYAPPHMGASVVSRPNKGRSFEVRPNIGATIPRRPNKGRSRRPNKGRSFPVRPNIGATVDQVGGCPTCLTGMRLACRRFPGFCEPLGCSDTQN